jgi:hypothetical protein
MKGSHIPPVDPPNNRNNNIPTPSQHTTTQYNQSFHQTYLTNLQDTTSHLPFGDLMLEKQQGTIRLYLQNINGAKLSQQQEAWEYAANYIKTNNIDYIGLVETRIDWNLKNQTIVKNQLTKKFSHRFLTTSMCRPNPLNEGTPGGTAVILVNQLVNRKVNVIIDQSGLGRWSGASFALPSQTLHIITCYRPNIDNKLNSNTTYQQQRRILQQQGHDNPNPSTQTLLDLAKVVKSLHQQQDKVIVMWDANAPLTNKLLQEFQTKTDLISLIQETPEHLSTYARGKNVIDHIFGSKSLLQSVSKSGYLPFYEGAWLSDHRPAFIDLQVNMEAPSDHKRSSRKLSSNNHKAVSRFLDNVKATSTISTLLQEILTLETKTIWTADDHTLFENIDQKLTTVLTTAEQTLQSNFDHPWSPQLHEAYEIHRYWQIQKMSLHNRIRQTDISLQLLAKYQEKLYQGNPSRSIYGQFYRSKQNLQATRKQSRQLRTEYLLNSILNAQFMSNTKKLKILQSIQKTESKLQCYRTFKNTSVPSTGGLSHIIIENSNELIRIDNKDEIESTLHQHFGKHFNQASGTPFTTGRLYEIFGYSGTNDSTQALLDNKLDTSTESKEMQTFLQQFRRTREPLSHQFPVEDIIQGFHKWKEKTTTSPSGLHLGIYKAIIKSMKSSNTDVIQLSTDIMTIISKLIQLSIRECHTFQRWQTIHNFTIEKIPGYPLLSKLRVIHIMEADWNLINKFFAGRQVLYEAIKNNTTSHEQAGGRPGRRSIEEALQTTITYDICNLLHLTGGITYNDAKSCYDRIPENLSNIAAMKQGLSPKIAGLHAQTHQTVKYYAKHKAGTSTLFNQHSSTQQFHGVGQGAGDSPARWGYISDNIITAYNNTSTDAIITSPITKTTSNQKVNAFVDDCRNMTINKSNLIYAALQDVGQNSQKWEKYLHCASAKLELDKTSFFVFGWKYDSDGNHTIDNAQNHQPLRLIESETGQTFTLRNMQTSDSYKLLGVHVPFTGQMTTHYKFLLEKCNKLCTTFNQLSLHANHILLAINTIAKPALAYSLPATTIAEKYLNTISNKLAYSVLPKLGYNRHFPRVLTMAPTKYGGLQLPDLYHLQGSMQVEMLVQHLQTNTSLTKAIIQMVEAYQLRTGILGSCLHNTKPVNYINGSWITNFRSYLEKTQCTIQTTSIGTLHRLRQRDESIMEYFQTLNITTKDLKILNNVRTFLQITTIAEISNNSGTKIHQGYSAHKPPTKRIPHSGQSLLQWPPQIPPTQKMWRVWLKKIQTLCKPSSWLLRNALGPWTQYHSEHRIWFGKQSQDTVFSPNSTWRKTRSTHATIIYTRDDMSQTPQVSKPFIPNDISDTYITGDKHIHEPITVIQEWPHNYIHPYVPNHEYDLQDRIQITLGYYQTTTGGACSWETQQQGKTPRTQSTTTPNIFQPSETTIVIIGILQCVNQLMNPHTSLQNIQFYTTKTIANKLQKQQPKLNQYWKQLIHLQQTHTISITFNEEQYQRILELNDLSQRYAGENKPNPTFYNPISSTILTVDKQEIVDSIAESLLQKRYKIKVKDFLTSKYNWNTNIFNDIDWELHGTIHQSSYRHKQFNIKFIHNWLPVASHPSQNNENHNCFRCDNLIEDQHHWYKCTCKEAVQMRTIQQNNTIEFLRHSKLHHSFQHLIIDLLYKSEITSTHHIQTACNNQQQIGWDHFLQGRLSKSMVQQQNRLTQRQDGNQVWTAIIIHILHSLHEIWLDRNYQLHSKDQNPLQRRMATIIIPKITSIYNLKSVVSSQDRQLFDLPLEEMLQQSPQHLERWISRHERYLQESARRESERIKMKNTAITNFFTHITPRGST